MRVIFVSSGNARAGISPIVLNQGNSLIRLGHEVIFFTIKGKGIKGYGKAIFSLRRFMKSQAYDVVHAHYSLSGMVAALGGARPLVVSLMGSDTKAGTAYRRVVKLFSKLFWDAVIVKSKDMQQSCGLSEAVIIPNGVDFERFRPLPLQESLSVTKWNQKKKHILFAADPNRKEKNFFLAQKAFGLLNDPNVELHVLDGVANEDVPYYLNSADVVLLTSLWEGSPNVIKEAMACNVPIVTTRCGDVEEVIGQTPFCFVTAYDAAEISDKLRLALSCGKKTKGREAIGYLSAGEIAARLTKVYEKICD